MDTRPVVHVAAAILRRADEIVLIRQAAQAEEPFWPVPDGLLEDGELVTEAQGIELLAVDRQSFTVDYLRGAVEPGPVRLQRRRADGRVEIL